MFYKKAIRTNPNCPGTCTCTTLYVYVHCTYMYIKVGNKVYRQTVGIPMGTDCVPQLANLFLFHYEYLYMKKLMKDNMCVAKMFSDTVRYIDDLLTLNNATFDAVIGEIYPKELSLKKYK